MSGRIATTELLAPAFRASLELVLADIKALGLPLRLYETVRSPVRQAELFARPIGTKARPYQSAHQFGEAADLVGFVRGGWTWELPASVWRHLSEIAANAGLEQLRDRRGELAEQPHIQTAEWDWHGLERGPLDDAGWRTWLAKRNGGA